MSVNYTAYTIVGILVAKQDLMTEQAVFECDHEIPPSIQAKFCPECGEPVKKTELGWIPEYNEEQETAYNLPVTQVGSDFSEEYILGVPLGTADELGRSHSSRNPEDYERSFKHVIHVLSTTAFKHSTVSFHTVLNYG